ncbi:MAG: PD-(D/E)XK nuclease family protein [Pelatocladus maniniholoensis HA4357-MV3]|uniref:PD-(D/E)XK nuclease family protein n=1 Tax=Pelatocladus maniniholoensis HA4357-MV3 TaxID=1117104 RepID=A0A9E3H9I5_9NOST|nr:PD-(D/E)XK nuclease family protein [Pelatocladus maniniholoensis HA4357-MV3]
MTASRYLPQLLEKDTQKFQQYFIEQRFPPHYSKSITQQNLGEQFHLLMQQLMMGLPVEPLLLTYPDMAHWVKQLHPIINIPAQKKLCNINKQMLIAEWRLVAHYDLLIEWEQKTIVVDWTTERHIPQPEKLEDSWKTQLRLFLLTETQEIPPQYISIIYCFVNEDEFPTIYQFNYNQERHDVFIDRLAVTLSKLPTTTNSTNESELSPENSMNEHYTNLQKFFKGEISAAEYLETVPEVEI